MDSKEESLCLSLIITVQIVVVVILLLLSTLIDLLKRVKIVSNVIIPALENPKVLGTLTLTVIVVHKFSTPPTTTVLVVVIATLWLHWLSVTIGPNQTCTDSKAEGKRLAVVVKEQSTLLPSQNGCLPLYKIPPEEKQIDIKGCKSFTFGEKSRNCNRNIMVLGASGAGKSTVINAMVNYVLGVRWEDSFRFKLVDEGQSKSKVQGQTSEITLYKLYHQEGFRVNYSLTIVDTPGFGGNGGIDRDKEITEQLRDLFTNQEGVGEIDAVCFVVQAAITELTSTQRYVFDSALSIFGKDVAENIRVLVTYADEQQLPVLEAIKVSGVPFPQSNDGLPFHFIFNNSVLFASNKFSAIRRTIGLNKKTFEFWKMGTKSMASFFDSLTDIRTIRLTMTKEVMEERKQLENVAEELQKKVKLGLAELEEIRMTKEKLQEHEAEIRQNENFEFHISMTKTEQVDISHTEQYITNCLQCHDDVVKLIAEAAKCLNRLKEIVLNPKPLTTPEYINMLMKGEEQEAKPGWKERLQSLEKMKEKADIIAKVEKGEKLLAYQ
ncbi:uncharacterized protein LOC105923706 [Fundulus heteroclitus]|uniref:uncharacterized protein LOC105923706 n=1 Tax=Fundulus heteroclitus TaxID=8078 RepID=UPI00165CCDCE|nr:uncharacterized protein LOC105923706 [Fundulus heteroclitus]